MLRTLQMDFYLTQRHDVPVRAPMEMWQLVWFANFIEVMDGWRHQADKYNIKYVSAWLQATTASNMLPAYI
jgi:hypothetical protein